MHRVERGRLTGVTEIVTIGRGEETETGTVIETVTEREI